MRCKGEPCVRTKALSTAKLVLSLSTELRIILVEGTREIEKWNRLLEKKRHFLPQIYADTVPDPDRGWTQIGTRKGIRIFATEITENTERNKKRFCLRNLRDLCVLRG